MKITLPFEGSKEEIELISKKYNVEFESLSNVKLSIVSSPLYIVEGTSKELLVFINKFMESIGCSGSIDSFLKVSNDKIFVYWERLGETFKLEYYLSAVEAELNQKAIDAKTTDKAKTEDDIENIKNRVDTRQKLKMDISKIL